MRLTPAYSVEKPGAGVWFASFIRVAVTQTADRLHL